MQKIQLGKHVDRISVWSDPVGNMIELNDGSFIAIGYNKIVTYPDVAALRAGDHSWVENWNVTGLTRGTDTLAQFIIDFYEVVTDEHFFVDVVKLIDGSSIAITAELVVHIEPDQDHALADDPDQLIAHYVEFKKARIAQRVALPLARYASQRIEYELDRLRQFEYMGMGIETDAGTPIGSLKPGSDDPGPENLLRWQHIAKESQWIGRIMGRGGPFDFNIFEHGHVSILEGDELIEGQVAAVTIYRYGNRSGEYVVWSKTMEAAVELSKARAMQMIMNESGDLYHAAIHVIAHDPGPLAKLARCEIISRSLYNETIIDPDPGTAENE